MAIEEENMRGPSNLNCGGNGVCGNNCEDCPFSSIVSTVEELVCDVVISTGGELEPKGIDWASI